MDEEKTLFDLEVDHATGEELLDMSRWQKLFGVLISVAAGIVLLTILFGWKKIERVMAEAFGSGGKFAFFIFIVILIAVVAATMAGLLVRGAGSMRTAVRTKDQALFNSGLNDLKTFFIIYGVISILGLLANLVAFI